MHGNPAPEHTAFKEHRNKIWKPMTVRAEGIIVEKLDALKREGHSPSDLLRTAIERGWQTVFPPHESTSCGASPKYKDITDVVAQDEATAYDEEFKCKI